MNQIVLLLLLFGDEPHREFTVPKSPQPEFGHGLTEQDAREGWISLFDGETTYGWQDATCQAGLLSGAESESRFQSFEWQADVVTGGTLLLGNQQIKLAPGRMKQTTRLPRSVAILLGTGLSVRSFVIRPLDLENVFDGKSFEPSVSKEKDQPSYPGWKVVPHPKLAVERQTKWSVVDGFIHAAGGPGALQLNGDYADFVLQIEVRTREELVNGGLFFRAIKDDFMNGYEAQLFNACYDHDPSQPARYSTGAIDDRLLARRLVSRDKTPFVMTVVAQGAHIATWVNGYQTVSWTDPRPPHENPREGQRLKAGSIQLQSHDIGSDLEFRRIRIREFTLPE